MSMLFLSIDQTTGTAFFPYTTLFRSQVAYAIGKVRPAGLYVDTFGTEKTSHQKIIAAINDVFDLRPAAIVRNLQLLRPIYQATAANGHFGRELPDFTWERTDKVDQLRAAVGW